MRYSRITHPFFAQEDSLLIAGNGVGVQRITLFHMKHEIPANWQEDHDLHPDIKQWIMAFLDGKHPSGLKLPLPSGTMFQQACWREMLAVPYGHTITYSQLAANAGNANAVRAAASACARNPLPLIIPCHRIVAKGGGLGGFAWGIGYKQKLLALESIMPA